LLQHLSLLQSFLAMPARFAPVLGLAVTLAGGARVDRHRFTKSKPVAGVPDQQQELAGPNISIVNGQPADECEWGWQVGLRNSDSGSPWCGGMLISPDWVLTAAHCLAGETSINVVAGKYSRSSNSGNEQSSWSDLIINHPSYNSRTTSHDFGLIRLQTPMQLNSCVGTIALPASDAPSGTSCWITGWGTLSSGGGVPSVLQEAQVTTISNTACYEEYSYTSSDIDDSMLCAQGINANGDITDACQGDSGGPLVCNIDGQWAIYGATSWGYGCAGAVYPGVWARIHYALGWIDDTMTNPPPPTPAPPGPCYGFCSAAYCQYASLCGGCSFC